MLDLDSTHLHGVCCFPRLADKYAHVVAEHWRAAVQQVTCELQGHLFCAETKSNTLYATNHKCFCSATQTCTSACKDA